MNYERAEDNLGFSHDYLANHVECMTGRLTEDEQSHLLSNVMKLADERGADFHFSGNVGYAGEAIVSIDRLRLTVGTVYDGYIFVDIDGLNVRQQFYNTHPYSPLRIQLETRALFEKLHELRHRHHNAQVVKDIEAGTGMSLSGPEQEVARLEAAMDDATTATPAPAQRTGSLVSDAAIAAPIVLMAVLVAAKFIMG